MDNRRRVEAAKFVDNDFAGIDPSWGRIEVIAPDAFLCDGQFLGDVVCGVSDVKWIVSASTILAHMDKLGYLFESVGDWKATGQLKMKIYKDFEWNEVITDTRIPLVKKAVRPLYAHCVDKNEAWLMLLHKSIAKLYGSYEALASPSFTVADGFLALTGGVSFSVNIWECTEDAIWTFLREHFLKRSAVATEIKSGIRRDKIPGDFPFQITDLAELDGSVRLIRIRNFWSEVSSDSALWSGSYSSADSIWIKRPELKEKLKFDPTANLNQSWWMPLTDYCKVFTHIFVCQLFNPSVYQTLVVRSGLAEKCHEPDTSFLSSLSSGNSSSSSPVLGQVKAKDALRGLVQGGAIKTADAPGDPRWLSNPQFKLKVKNASGSTGDFVGYISMNMEWSSQNSLAKEPPVTLCIFKGVPGEKRVWTYKPENLIANIEGKKGEALNLPIPSLVSSSTCWTYYLVVYHRSVTTTLGEKEVEDEEESLKNVTIRVFTLHNNVCTFSKVHSPIMQYRLGNWKFLGGSARSGVGWSMNPQFLIDSRRSARISLEISLSAGSVLSGITVKKLSDSYSSPNLLTSSPPSASQCAIATVRKRVINRMETGNIQVPFSNTKRHLPLTEQECCIESRASELPSILLDGLCPSDFPLIIVPWRAKTDSSVMDTQVSSEFSLIIHSDQPLDRFEALSEETSETVIDCWGSSNVNPGNIMYFPESPECLPTSVPVYQLILHNDAFASVKTAQFTLTVCRNESDWKKRLMADAVGCMLGFYVIMPSRSAGINKHSELVHSASFAPGNMITEQIEVSVVGDSSHESKTTYLILPCTYSEGKNGNFLLSLTCLSSELVKERHWSLSKLQ